jgi:hypothetical protein
MCFDVASISKAISLTVTYKVEKKCPIESKNEPEEAIDAGKPG